jgi:Holliday junction resolvase RusA-like endonuclease
MRWSPEQLAEYEAKRAEQGRQPVDVPFLPPAEPEAEPVTITVPGKPQGKGRARAFVSPRTGQVGHYTPKNTVEYENQIRAAATVAMGGRQPLAGPVEMVMRAVMAIPTSWPLRKRQQALTGEIKPTTKPDLDNVAKAFKDALNGVAYVDDSQIVRATLEKRYGNAPFVVATVREIL